MSFSTRWRKIAVIMLMHMLKFPTDFVVEVSYAITA